MKKLPSHIQTEFLKFINDEISVDVFEQWVYNLNELEDVVESKDYIEFISLNFKSRHFIHDMKKIIGKYLEFSELEKRRIDKILNDLINKNDDFIRSLMATYDMYCDGYYFLDNIGLGYGLTFVHDFYDYSDFNKLTSTEKEQRIDAIYDGVKTEAEKVLNWLNGKIIVLTGELNEMGHYIYNDYRTEEEKKPSAYSVKKTKN